MTELWKEIIGYPDYRVINLGRVICQQTIQTIVTGKRRCING